MLFRSFIKTFQKKEVPDDIVEVMLAVGEKTLIDLLVETKLAASKSEARRVIEEGGVRVNGEVMKAIASSVKIGAKAVLIQKGKRHFVKVRAK